jgi:hypothetical protein
MTSDLSLTLTACLLFLILSSRYAYTFIKKIAALTDDMATVGMTVLFGFLFTLALKIV